MIPEAEEIAAQFRAARARKGVSQRDLSARAGVQLRFSAVHAAGGGLTIPASGIGGNWIVTLRQRRRSIGNAIIAAFNDAAQNAPRSARRKFRNTLNIKDCQFLRSECGGCCFRQPSAASICDCDCQSIA
ncbi:hypothetical protein ACTTAF_06725 [Rhodobacter capsulatus]|uniref:hypothetical protein n=1 Tax=Rhodobacter capsulatus TaxID=1061 RepID=UPI0009BCBD8B|nr:hypothetical protein [Rhodobacter capsulatus]